MNASERPEVRPSSPESAERAAKGRYTAATVRVMAGLSPTEMGKSVGELNIDDHKQRLKEMQPFNLDHSHIVEVSTQERLRDSKARIDFPPDIKSEEQKAKFIAERNRKWREDVLNWLDTVPDSVANAVDRVYSIDRKNKKEADERLEKLRAEVFDTKSPAGEADIASIVTDFVLEYNEAAGGGIPLPEETVEQDLEEIKPFLYIFGGEKTVTRLEHAILATSALLHAPQGEGRVTWVEEVAELLKEPVSPGVAKQYEPFSASDAVTLGVNGTPVADEAPVDADVAAKPEQGGQGSGAFAGGDRTRRGVGGEAPTGNSGAGGDGGSGGGEKAAERQNTTETYAATLLHDIERVMNARGNEKLKAAYEGMLAKLGEPTVIRVPLVDGKAIRAEMITIQTENGEKEVVDRVGNDFVMYEAADIDLGDPNRKPWIQGMLRNQTRKFTLDLFGKGKAEYELAGLVGLVRGPDGRILINLTQEPAAQYLPKRAVFRTPMQTSATKIDAVLDGNTDLDPTIADVMRKIFPDKTLRDLLASGDVHHFFPPDADGNRLVSDNLGFELVVSDKALWEELLHSGKYYAASDKDIDMLSSAKLVNGITSSSNSAARGASLLRSEAA